MLEPRGAGLAPGFDPLEYIISRAHAAGISVHAWINVYRVWGAGAGPTDLNHPINAHPDWIKKNVAGNTRATDGYFIDPAVPEAREHIVSVVEDIARRYPVDGIHLDSSAIPVAPGATLLHCAESLLSRDRSDQQTGPR